MIEDRKNIVNILNISDRKKMRWHLLWNEQRGIIPLHHILIQHNSDISSTSLLWNGNLLAIVVEQKTVAILYDDNTINTSKSCWINSV